MEKQLLLVLPKHTSAGQSAGGGGPENAHSCPQAVFGQLHEPRGGTTGLAHPTPQSAPPSPPAPQRQAQRQSLSAPVHSKGRGVTPLAHSIKVGSDREERLLRKPSALLIERDAHS